MNEFEKYSEERKKLVESGEVPEWYITQGWIMFKRKYASYEGETVRGAFERVAKTLSKHVPELKEAESKFFDILWKGHLAPSTPVICNVGTNKGHPVSCSGGYFDDSVDSFYINHHENAMLSKYGYGTSSYLGDIRSRGSSISIGGNADGVVPVFDTAVDVARKVSQGSSRRGSWAGYLPVDHDDFEELCGYILKNPGSANVGWCFSDEFIERLQNGDKEAIARWNKVLYIRARTGKGYIWKTDTVNRLAPQSIKNSGITIKGSNLCSEIALPQDKDHTFSCVLSSLNLSKWDEFDKDTIYWSIVFLDCVVSEMIDKAKGQSGFDRIVRFTEKSRALGLGTLGFHSYLQKNNIAFEELRAQYVNDEIFKTINTEATRASKHLAELYGEPLWCEGTGQRNATLMAVAPNTSSALLCGGQSQGIEPYVANAYNQNTSAGEMVRMNPSFVNLAKDKGKYSDKLMEDIAINYEGSVQHLDWLTDHEKLVFKTAYEIDQSVIVRLASLRQKYIDQGQSLNLFFGTNEKYIAEVTKQAILDPNIKGLYYQRSLRNVRASKGECVACEG